MKSKLYYDLLNIIEKQDEMINEQNILISELVNENAEKENMINTISKREEYLY